ncbi:exodeoxyribonuclease VII large subunit [Candidatus Saccharibacteria bacterium]|nr:exodeoxyribonuclease VII large subunit [Candidatus Saccharibacteria bacterium]
MIGSDPKLTVSEFVELFNQTLELTYPFVDIVGELSNFRISKNRWVYFDLKDETSSVKFFGTKDMLPGPLEDGINLEVIGYPRLHNRYGLSINISNLRVVGEGSIAKAQALLAKKLEAEGLFSPERKRALPYPPKKIGLITSVGSAAYADFIKIINARWPHVEINVAESLVQGLEAPGQIVHAVEKFNQMSQPMDVLALIRGGGSTDDLAAFSTEQVVRAVAASRAPTIVAIGHEIDLSLAELAADVRASTPSNAAEMLVPDKKSELQSLFSQNDYMKKAIESILKISLDESKLLKEDLVSRMNTKIDLAQHDLRQKSEFINVLNPLLPLKKGYAIVRDKTGQQIRSATNVKKADDLSIQFSDGKIKAKAS